MGDEDRENGAIHHFNTEEELERLFRCVKYAAKLFKNRKLMESLDAIGS